MIVLFKKGEVPIQNIQEKQLLHQLPLKKVVSRRYLIILDILKQVFESFGKILVW